MIIGGSNAKSHTTYYTSVSTCCRDNKTILSYIILKLKQYLILDIFKNCSNLKIKIVFIFQWTLTTKGFWQVGRCKQHNASNHSMYLKLSTAQPNSDEQQHWGCSQMWIGIWLTPHSKKKKVSCKYWFFGMDKKLITYIRKQKSEKGEKWEWIVAEVNGPLPNYRLTKSLMEEKTASNKMSASREAHLASSQGRGAQADKAATTGRLLSRTCCNNSQMLCCLSECGLNDNIFKIRVSVWSDNSYPVLHMQINMEYLLHGRIW